MPIDRRILYHFDWRVFVLTALLGSIGLLAVISASYRASVHNSLHPLVVRQLVWLCAGLVLMLSAAFFDYRSLGSYAYALYCVGLLIQALVLVGGHARGGARRWLNLGFIALEPSELTKLVLIIVLAHFLREKPPTGGLKLRHLIAPTIFTLPRLPDRKRAGPRLGFTVDAGVRDDGLCRRHQHANPACDNSNRGLGRASGMALPKALSAPANRQLSKSTVRSAGCWLPRNSVGDRGRLWRTVG